MSAAESRQTRRARERHEKKTADAYRCTDLGNSERFARDHKDELRFARAIGWLVWDGTRWATDRTGEVERLAAETVRAMYVEAAALDDPKERASLAQWAAISESRARLEAMLKLAQSQLCISISDDAFDRHHYLLNTLSGIVDVTNGECSGHNPDRYITRLAAAFYEPDHPCPKWLAFLDRILNGKLEMIDFIQRAVGYSLTGSVAEQCLFMLYGTGANGKTTLLETVRTILGDYAMHTPAETLMMKSGGIPNDVARLRGARFVTAVETDDGRRVAEPLVKMITGGDTITARFLHREFFEFRPTFKIWLATNHRPVIQGTDYAIWRRIRLIPFTVTIPPGECNKNMVEHLLTESTGILAWAVQGALQWKRLGLAEARDVVAATETYRQEMDPVADWIADRCIVRDGIEGLGLFVNYEAWAKENGRRPLDGRAFARRLEERGYARARRGGQNYFQGIALIADQVPERYPRAAR
jgi:putative DNA primase/helicase